MSCPLHILCLENDVTDAQLLQDTLETEGIACELNRVEAECEFRAALERGGFDLILADYTLPSFDGMSALRMVRQQLPDVPFIFVSGTLGEEVAIEALKTGATDYVFKTRLSRLAPAIHRAMREAAARAELRRSEETLREQASLLSLTHDAVYVRDLKGAIQYWNRGAEDLYGWPQADALGKVAHELLKTVSPLPFEEIEAELLRTSRWEGELVKTGKDGTELLVASRWSLKRDDTGKPIAILVTSNDITARKRAEEVARRSEKELRDAIEVIPAMVFIALPGASNAFISRPWREYTGLSAQDTSGSGWQTAIHPDDLERHLKKWQVSSATGEPFEDEARFRRAADGEYRWFLIRAVPLHDDLGDILRWYGVLTDIEDRKRAEALLAGEKRILEMVAKGDSLPEILNSLCRLVEEQARGTRASILLVEAGRLHDGGALNLPKEYIDAIDGVAIGPEVGSCGTAAYLRKQVIVEDIATDPLWTEYRAAALPHSLRACWSTPIFSSGGEVIGTFAMYYQEPRKPSERDQEIIEQITHLAGVAIERKMTFEQLQRSQAYLTEAQRLAHAGSWAWNPCTEQCFHWSEEMFQIFAIDPQQGLPTSETFWARIHPEDRESMRELLRKSALQKAEYAHDHRIVLPDRSVKYLHAIGHPILDEAGELVEFVGTAMDVTERKRAEQTLRESETRFRKFVDHAGDAFFVYDLEQKTVVDVNREACESLGYTRQELIGKTPFAYHMDSYQAEMESVAERAMAGEIVFDTHWHRRKDGTVLPVEVHTSVVSYAGRRFLMMIARDISDRLRAEEQRDRLRQLEAELAHMDRVSILGELAASIAHEVNQPLSGIVSSGSACLRWLAADPPNFAEVREAIRRIVGAGKHAGEVIARIRALTKRTEAPKEKLDLNETIREVLVLVADQAKTHKVILRTRFADGLSPVLGDRVQFQQVVLNLVINAIEAMSSVSDRARELVITTRNLDPEQVQVTVEDSGTGIDPNTINKIFDPFYTTKSTGMGMGLSISRSILQHHGGRLWATADHGPGTSFHFAVPKYREEESNAGAA